MKHIQDILSQLGEINEIFTQNGFKNPCIYKSSIPDSQNVLCLLVEKGTGTLNEVSLSKLTLEQQIGCKVSIAVKEWLSDYFSDQFSKNSIPLQNVAAIEKEFSQVNFEEIEPRVQFTQQTNQQLPLLPGMFIANIGLHTNISSSKKRKIETETTKKDTDTSQVEDAVNKTLSLIENFTPEQKENFSELLSLRLKGTNLVDNA